MQIFLCHYVPKDSEGDLLSGYDWREALLVLPDNRHVDITRDLSQLMPEYVDSLLIDRKTGKETGETRNYCVNPRCDHIDCGPAYLLAQFEPEA